MAKPYNMPVIPHGSSVYNYHFVMANTNSPYAEYLSVGEGKEIQPIFSVIEGEPLPVNGKISLDPSKPGFGVELRRELLAQYKN
ncbi:MAG TPA: L-rhamnonate dehydratase, partial [Candidatus Eisenbacteria bacterium]|nr:L-rhamnonate dehydratase [Candidatus Eisenbacteria bacterium]